MHRHKCNCKQRRKSANGGATVYAQLTTAAEVAGTAAHGAADTVIAVPTGQRPRDRGGRLAVVPANAVQAVYASETRRRRKGI